MGAGCTLHKNFWLRGQEEVENQTCTVPARLDLLGVLRAQRDCFFAIYPRGQWLAQMLEFLSQVFSSCTVDFVIALRPDPQILASWLLWMGKRAVTQVPSLGAGKLLKSKGAGGLTILLAPYVGEGNPTERVPGIRLILILLLCK